MLQVKSFEFFPGYGYGVDTVDMRVNSFIQDLSKKGITDCRIEITSTSKTLVYTVIYNEPREC